MAILWNTKFSSPHLKSWFEAKRKCRQYHITSSEFEIKMGSNYFKNMILYFVLLNFKAFFINYKTFALGFVSQISRKSECSKTYFRLLQKSFGLIVHVRNVDPGGNSICFFIHSIETWTSDAQGRRLTFFDSLLLPKTFQNSNWHTRI